MGLSDHLTQSCSDTGLSSQRKHPKKGAPSSTSRSMKQGDFEMYCEPQGAFFPMDKRAASLIVLHEFAEPFGCNGSTAYGDHLFEYMRRA